MKRVTDPNEKYYGSLFTVQLSVSPMCVLFGCKQNTEKRKQQKRKESFTVGLTVQNMNFHALHDTVGAAADIVPSVGQGNSFFNKLADERPSWNGSVFEYLYPGVRLCYGIAVKEPVYSRWCLAAPCCIAYEMNVV